MSPRGGQRIVWSLREITASSAPHSSNDLWVFRDAPLVASDAGTLSVEPSLPLAGEPVRDLHLAGLGQGYGAVVATGGEVEARDDDEEPATVAVVGESVVELH